MRRLGKFLTKKIKSLEAISDHKITLIRALIRAAGYYNTIIKNFAIAHIQYKTVYRF